MVEVNEEWRCANCLRHIADVGDGEARDICGDDWCQECAEDDYEVLKGGK